jgi:hypothetical protein
VVPRASSDAVAKRKIYHFPCRKSNPGRPALSLVPILTELLRLLEIDLYRSEFLCGLFTKYIRGCIQKFQDWPPGARTANGTALYH